MYLPSWISNFLSTVYWKICPFPSVYSATSIISWIIYLWIGLLLGFSSILLVHLSLPLLVPNCLPSCNFKINLGIQLKAFHPLYSYWHWICLLGTHKPPIGIFIGFSLNIGSVGEIGICNVGSSSPKLVIAFHLVRLTLTFLDKIL